MKTVKRCDVRNRKLVFGAVSGFDEIVLRGEFFSVRLPKCSHYYSILPIPFPFACIFAAATVGPKNDRCVRKNYFVIVIDNNNGQWRCKSKTKTHLWASEFGGAVHKRRLIDWKVCAQMMLWTRLQIYIIATEVQKLKWAHARKENAVTEMSMRSAASAIETHKLLAGGKNGQNSGHSFAISSCAK